MTLRCDDNRCNLMYIMLLPEINKSLFVNCLWFRWFIGRPIIVTTINGDWKAKLDVDYQKQNW